MGGTTSFGPTSGDRLDRLELSAVSVKTDPAICIQLELNVRRRRRRIKDGRCCHDDTYRLRYIIRETKGSNNSLIERIRMMAQLYFFREGKQRIQSKKTSNKNESTESSVDPAIFAALYWRHYSKSTTLRGITIRRSLSVIEKGNGLQF